MEEVTKAAGDEPQWIIKKVDHGQVKEGDEMR